MPKFLLLFVLFISVQVMAQPADLQKAKDSTLKAIYTADSLKVEKEFAGKMEEAAMMGKLTFPLLNAGTFSGVFPVTDPSEKPDPNMDYKILFELVSVNADSISGEINESLAEICRVINLHVASGIPVKRIMPVIVVHGPGLAAFTTNAWYQDRYKKDNPNIKIIGELEKLGARFIACGQAMAFMNFKNADMLPQVKISITAQTALTAYQLKGYVWRKVVVDK